MASAPGKITFGQQLGSLETGGFVFTETYHRPGVVLPRHDHECANFNLTVGGMFSERVNGRDQECGSATLGLKPPGEAHSNRYGGAGARCLIVEVTPARLGALGTRHRLFGGPSYVRGGPLVALAGRMYAELRAGGCASELVLEGLALEFLGELARESGRASPPAPPRWLLEARDAIHAGFAGPVGLSALAEAAGVDPTHLARAFRKAFGCSVGEYVRRLRLEHATEQLTATDMPLAEIAAAAGFYDQSHFTNAFKLHRRLTPAEFRSAFRGGRGAPTRPRPSKTGRRPAG